MTADERRKYQAFVKQCIRRKAAIRIGSGTYKVLALIYRLSTTGDEIFSVELFDTNGCDSMMTVSLEQLYKENCDEMCSEQRDP